MRTFPQTRSQPSAPVETRGAYDSRFRRLIPPSDWATLEPAIRARFIKRLAGADLALYPGRIEATELNVAGWLLAQACRLIGAPLPLYGDAGVAAAVIVSEDPATGGQRWTRIYHRHRGNPQVINSAKAFAGPTGLEELVGGGIGMALTVAATPDRLVFTSAHYFVQVLGHRVRLPAWLTPGTTTVTHRDLGDGRFAFDLEVRHRWFGRLVRQHALFRDT